MSVCPDVLFNLRHAIVAASILWCSAPVAAQEVVCQEEEVKASFPYHFATFVQWPEKCLSSAVLGRSTSEDEVAAKLEKFLPGLEIQGRPCKCADSTRSTTSLSGSEISLLAAQRTALELFAAAVRSDVCRHHQRDPGARDPDLRSGRARRTSPLKLRTVRASRCARCNRKYKFVRRVDVAGV
jgi:hypothetical protein